ncbi:MAG: carboxypeptidase-like regulatory domain-containing protein [Porphyromonadaceae bacterium]|nr:MAG: carboxypeptidase-like regulatory domain-containing protein [Porphyromonadaceae bacterium]
MTISDVRIILILGLLTVAGNSFAQVAEYKVTGFVYDSLGMAPLAYVNISVAGTKRGATTNRDGFFKINIATNQTVLYFSYMGYGVRECSVYESTKMPLTIYMTPEIRKIGEVTVKNSRFRNILEGDSLKVLDYEIWNDRLLVLAQSAGDSLKQRIYLTSLGGYIYSYRNLKDIGKSIKFPEDPSPKKIYLFTDTYGEVQLLAKTRVWQIYLRDNKIFLLYPSKYEDCANNLFPIKCRLNDKLFYQESNEKYNGTFFTVRGTDSIKRVKLISDEFGKIRYLRQRSVAVPLIVYNQQVVLFNFFQNEMEFFNERGRSVKTIPTLFHAKWYYDKQGKKAYDLDETNFTQDIIQDPVANKVYSIWRTVLTGRYTLKEINMETGEVVRDITIPDHPFIDKVLVNDNQVYFMFRDREEQRYKTLYTMRIL